MPLNVGQLRKNNLNSYTVPLSYSLEDVERTDDIFRGMTFIDKGINIQSNPLKLDKSYYLNFNVYYASTPQNFSIYLRRNQNNENDNLQKIKDYNLPQGPTDQYVSYELVISPNNEYTEIIFELARNENDYTSTEKRVMNIQINNLEEINNVLESLGIESIQRLGVQGAPGMLMCINGEEIRIGRTGIFELLSDITVDFIGFVVKDSDYFILDYQY